MSENVDKLRKTLSENLKKRRKMTGISQEKLAELAGLSLQTINGIEGRRLWVSDATMIKLADALQIEAYELLVPKADFSEPAYRRLPLDIVLNIQHNLGRHLKLRIEDALDSYFLSLLKKD